MSPAKPAPSPALLDADALATATAARAPPPVQPTAASDALPASPSPVTEALKAPELAPSHADTSAAATGAASAEASASLEGQPRAKLEDGSRGVLSSEGATAKIPQDSSASAGGSVSVPASPAGAEVATAVAGVLSDEVLGSPDKSGQSQEMEAREGAMRGESEQW